MFLNTGLVCLPKCPKNQTSIYYNHVWGNKIQEIQLNQKNNFYYKTNDINYYSDKIADFYNNHILFIPTSLSSI